MASNTKREVSNEMVYCPTVSTTYYLIRRNNKISITGNTSYLMGPRVLCNQVFIQSEGKIVINEKTALDLQRLFSIRYRVQLWHRWMERHLAKQPYPAKLTCASGSTRTFFGRPREILGEALAHEPQNVTTYVTNTAMLRLWDDPDNRVGNRLRVEPLHQVHDALLGQFRIEDTAWAVAKIRSWFHNPIMIAGQRIVIPFEGSYGTNWALDAKSRVGDI